MAETGGEQKVVGDIAQWERLRHHQQMGTIVAVCKDGFVIIATFSIDLSMIISKCNVTKRKLGITLKCTFATKGKLGFTLKH